MFSAIQLFNALGAALSFILLAAFIRKQIRSKARLPLPPGPSGRWFSTTLITSAKAEEWVRQYGPVVSITEGGNVTVIVGRHQAAVEIMEKQGAALFDRPRFMAAQEILSEGLRIVLMRAGDRLKTCRRVANSHLQLKVARTYEPIQMEDAKKVVLDLLERPDQHLQHVIRYAASVILKITYGKATPTAFDSPEVKDIHRSISRFQYAARPGQFLVDRYPFLRYVPGFIGDLKLWREDERKLFRRQLNRVQEDMALNQATPSFSRYVLEHADEHKLTPDEIAYLTGAFYGAGSDTTAVAITTLIMAAACYPEAQAKVHAELDEFIGRDSAPTFAHLDMLPQLHAFILEGLRWRPVSSLGFAHRATKDIIWKNYLIPAGATVLGNHWAISRDPEVYPNPEKFDPQRWFDKEGKVKEHMKFFTYGFGRRVCLGLHVANRSIFINLALILWSFKISKKSGDIDTDFSDGVISHPKPFDVNFELRVPEEKLRDVMKQEEM